MLVRLPGVDKPIRVRESQRDSVGQLFQQIQEDNPQARQMAAIFSQFISQYEQIALHQSQQMQDMVDSVRESVGREVKIPEIKIPEIKAPTIELPTIELPKFELPKIPTPEVPVTVEAPIVNMPPQPVPEEIKLSNIQRGSDGRIKSCTQRVLKWKTA